MNSLLSLTRTINKCKHRNSFCIIFIVPVLEALRVYFLFFKALVRCSEGGDEPPLLAGPPHCCHLLLRHLHRLPCTVPSCESCEDATHMCYVLINRSPVRLFSEHV